MPTSSTFWRPKSGMSIRAFITVLLVVAVVAIIVGGMIAGKAAGDMTQYLAPINSLASLALGYWFGAEK
jgi:type II secretory pathway component PulK